MNNISELLNIFKENHNDLFIRSKQRANSKSTSLAIEITAFMETCLLVQRLGTFTTIQEVEDLYKEQIQETYKNLIKSVGKE